jgi:fucose permease
MATMTSGAFGAIIEPISGPAKIMPRDIISRPSPGIYELDSMQWGQRLNGPKDDKVSSYSPTPTPRKLERSAPSTPKQDHAVDAALIQTASNPHMNRWRLASAAVFFFLMGVNDASSGALIPYVEKYYKIGYAVVSLIFVGNALGFILAAPLVNLVESQFGRAKTYVFVTSLMSLGYTAIICTPPFPVVVVSFLVLGFAMGLFLAITNAFVINLVNGTVILGAMHGLYGLGGVVSPLMATAMVSRGIHWSYFYAIPISLAVFSIPFMGWSYWTYEKDLPVQLFTALEQTASRHAAAEAGNPSKAELLRRAMKNRTTLLGAAFIFAYQGAEVSISGWVISFLIHARKGDPSKVGNVTSGFWAGITVGRFALTHFAHKIGEKTAVIGLIIGAAAFQLLVWLVPSIITDAVAEAIVGVFLGPVYPCATAVFSRLLPRNIQISSLGFVASMGSSGGAVAPFFTGLLAQKVGTVVLHPICLALFVAMEISWLMLPRTTKHRE